MKGKVTRGVLGSFVMKTMKEKKLLPAHFPNLSDGKLNPTMIRRVANGEVPREPEIIDTLADVLGVNRKILRTYAVQDSIEKAIEHYAVGREDVIRGVAKGKTYRIPVYESNELRPCLSDEGYPAQKSRYYITTPYDYGPHAYGILVKDRTLYPRAMPGEICIVAVGKKISEVDFGVVGTKDAVLCGQVRVHPRYVIVETLLPFETKSIENKNVKFAYSIYAVLRAKLLSNNNPRSPLLLKDDLNSG